MLRSLMVPGERREVVVCSPRLEGVFSRVRPWVLRGALVVPLLRAKLLEPGVARLTVGTPLDVVREGVEVERDSPLLELLPVPRVVLPDERLTPLLLEPLLLERLMPPLDEPLLELLLIPLLELELPDERLLVPDERLVPDDLLLLPELRLTPPLLRLEPDEELPELPPDDLLTPPLEREVPPDERLTPPLLPELRLIPPLDPPELFDALEPPLERELPPFSARCASTTFSGAANNATAATANMKKKIRLGVGISDLRRLTRA